jgi:hypothetical protein
MVGRAADPRTPRARCTEVIADKSPKKKDRKVAAQEKNVERHESSVNSENPLTTVKNFVCKYLC